MKSISYAVAAVAITVLTATPGCISPLDAVLILSDAEVPADSHTSHRCRDTDASLEDSQTAVSDAKTGADCKADQRSCHGKILHECKDGHKSVTDCEKNGLECDEKAGCILAQCNHDHDCHKYEQPDGFFCRGDKRCSSRVFETVWEITSPNLTIQLPYFHEEQDLEKCVVKIRWGDEANTTDGWDNISEVDCSELANRSHTYAVPGTYHVKILGKYHIWGQKIEDRSFCETALTSLKKVIHYGSVVLGPGAFCGVGHLMLPSHDFPDGRHLHRMDHGFFQARLFNQPLNHWDISHIRTLAGLFRSATMFNQPVDRWNTEKTTDLSWLFMSAVQFNQPVNTWKTASVMSMNGTFFRALNFNQPVDHWDTSRVMYMDYLFSLATEFDQPLTNWNTSKVQSMHAMFENAYRFNRTLSHFDTSQVKDMGHMFNGAFSFNHEIANWNTSQVKDMSFMFSNTDQFNQPIGNWKTSNVTNMEKMFTNAISFNRNIGAWNVSRVTNMAGMFERAVVFNQPFNNWNTSGVTNMSRMFAFAKSFNRNIGRWNVSRVTNMAGMFEGASVFNQPIDTWNTSGVTNMSRMFASARSFNRNIGRWDVSHVTNMAGMFEGASEFDQDLGEWKLNKHVILQDIFKDSGLSKKNYCKLISKNIWKDNISKLGIKKYTCP